jgi:hypothetical protein
MKSLSLDEYLSGKTPPDPMLDYGAIGITLIVIIACVVWAVIL